jgi:mono/diheme cytochrome c family protein
MFSTRPKTAIAVVASVALAAVVTACGTQEISVPKETANHRGAVLFQERCAGCHSLAVAGSNGSASNVRKALRPNGPNFNVRKESYERVIYAIQNGGFSGAIMPQNIVTGADAKLVANFVAKYAGADVHTPPSPGAGGMSGGMSAPAAAAPVAAAPKQDLAAEGETLFNQNGCAGCHSLKAGVKIVGPSLAGVGADPSAQITKSIVNPNAQIEPGYAANIMPQNFGKLLTPQQIQALVAYLQKVAR